MANYLSLLIVLMSCLFFNSVAELIYLAKRFVVEFSARLLTNQTLSAFDAPIKGQGDSFALLIRILEIPRKCVNLLAARESARLD